MPAQITNSLIGHLKERIAEVEVHHRSSGFEHGERVVIEDGPLAALDAVFDRALDAPARVQILVQLMHRTLPVQIDPAHLRSLHGGAGESASRISTARVDPDSRARRKR